MQKATSSPTIQAAIFAFLENAKIAYQSNHTYTSYRSDLLGVNGFLPSLSPELKGSSPIDSLSERHAVAWIQSILTRGAAPATRKRAASCLRSFFSFCAYEYDIHINMEKFKYALKLKHLLPAIKDGADYPGEKIKKILDFTLRTTPHNLQEYRDLAFIWALAETGARVGEACEFRIGQINSKWQVEFTGKGKKRANIKIGKHARKFISLYLRSREKLDTGTGKARIDLPLFARHDLTVGVGKVKKISTKRAQAIIHNLALLALGEEYDETITCHKFRHYFITSIYQYRGDIKAAQELGRHESIGTTQRYTHRNSVENTRISEEVFG